MGNIVIFGAGRVGKSLLKLLERQPRKIFVVEQNKQVCEELAMGTNATVVNGDMTNPEVLDELKLAEADYVFAVTGREEVNFLCSIYSKEAGAKKVIARVTEGKHALIFERLGIDAVVSEYTLAKEIANKVTSPVIYKLLDPKVSEIELYERIMDKGYAGKKIKDVGLDSKSMAVALFQKGEFVVAKPDVAIAEGATLIVVRAGR